MKILSLRGLIFKITELTVIYGKIPDEILYDMIEKVRDKQGRIKGFRLKLNIPQLIIKYDKKGNITGWEQRK